MLFLQQHNVLSELNEFPTVSLMVASTGNNTCATIRKHIELAHFL